MIVKTPAIQGSVLLVSEPLLPGGLAVYANNVMTSLTEQGIKHPAITSTEPEVGLLAEAELQNVLIVNGLFWNFWRPFVFRQLVNWAREQETVLIHGLSAATFQVCSRLANALKVPFIAGVHHYQKFGSVRSEKLCHAFIAVSEPLRANLVEKACIPTDRVRLIPGGVRVPKLEELRLADDFGAAGGPVPLVTSIGKFIPRKDMSTYLRAARIVLDKLGSDCSFVLAGQGPEETALRKLARELNIDKHITFCHGTASHADLLRDTDVYVQCSKQEGFGTMVLQAMAQCTPVVATNVGGLQFLVKDNKTGYLVAPGNPEQVADRILTLLSDPALCKRYGEAAHQKAEAEFSLEQMMQQTLALYEEAIETTVGTRQ